MKTKIYAEFGLGNKTITSTEFERGKKEVRVKGFMKPSYIDWLYVRLWIGYTVFILSTKPSIERVKKNRRALKLVFGIAGHD